MEIIKIGATMSQLTINSCDAVQVPQQMRKIGVTRRSVSGAFAFRGEYSIPYESTLERDFLVRKEFSPSVLEVIPQPVQIPFTALNGRNYMYTPDFLVYFRSGNYPWGEGLKPSLIEVKPREEIQKRWLDMKPKFKAALGYARERGWDFRIHDESRIRDQVFENIMFLRRYKRMKFPSEETQWILANLREMGQAPFQYLLGRHFNGRADSAVGVSHLWHMLALGLVECDMTLPLKNDTVFWVPNHG